MPPVLLEDKRISRYAAVRPRSGGVPAAFRRRRAVSARENVEGIVEAFRGGVE